MAIFVSACVGFSGGIGYDCCGFHAGHFDCIASAEVEACFVRIG